MIANASIRNKLISALALCSYFSVIGCSATSEITKTEELQGPIRIAFMPDIHFHDVYADFEDGSYGGVKNSISGQGATIRTMEAQMHSTRLFNENYFALLAALDDVVARGVKLVALPGDFSDDGQPIHIRGVRRILDQYREEHGLEFFAAPGNHDPVRPFDSAGGKLDFLGADGHEQRIFSKGAKECIGYEGSWSKIHTGEVLPTICTQEIRHLGYQGIMEELAGFGFYPKPADLYWETPYSDYQNYEFNEAFAQAQWHNRQYEICRQGAGGRYKKSVYTDCTMVPDASYLVEPAPGLWLLAIDANVYVPQPEGQKGQSSQSSQTSSFEGSGNAGYNRMLTHKTHVLEWMQDVVVRANAADKQLIAFSHFPMTEFYDGQSKAIGELFGQESFQLQRRPEEHVSKSLADIGLKVHVGGHMHMNDTGIVRGENGNVLFNIQAPSLAAYVPAYKLMTLQSKGQVEIETVVLGQVPRFSELFEHYHQEYKVRTHADAQPPWNKAILDSQNYREFTDWHIHELTRQRFLPAEWPEVFKQHLFSLSGEELVVLALLHSREPIDPLTLPGLIDSSQWREAKEQARSVASQEGLELEDFASWTGFDLAVDFYRLRNAGGLARNDIENARLGQYQLLTRLTAGPHALEHRREGDDPLAPFFIDRFGQLLLILEAFQNGAPDDHFMLNLKSGEIQAIPDSRRTTR